jgi:hypothetical protein
MDRLREMGRDAAHYFGLAESRKGTGRDEEPWWHGALRVALVLSAALLLRGALGFDDDFTGYLATLGIVAVLAVALGLGERLVRRRFLSPSS